MHGFESVRKGFDRAQHVVHVAGGALERSTVRGALVLCTVVLALALTIAVAAVALAVDQGCGHGHREDSVYHLKSNFKL